MKRCNAGGLWRYAAYLTSAKGEVMHRCAVNDSEHSVFLQADAIHADGRLPIENLLAAPRRVYMGTNAYSTVLVAPFEQWRIYAAPMINGAGLQFSCLAYPDARAPGRF
jgi:hypothetical protein